jgi:hypothetical protein
MTFHIEVDDDQVTHELSRLSRGPGADGTTFALEAIWLGAFAATQAHVHVLTGRLKATGHPRTEFDGERWEGFVGYVRHPGIFELARGDRPTRNHPEGGHYFLAPMFGTHDAMEQAVLGFLRGDHIHG